MDLPHLLCVSVATETHAGSAVQLIDLASVLAERGLCTTEVVLTLNPALIDSRRLISPVLVDGVIVRTQDPSLPLTAQGTSDGALQRLVVLAHVNALEWVLRSELRPSHVFAYNGISGPLGANVRTALSSGRINGLVSVASKCEESTLRQLPSNVDLRLAVIEPSTIVRTSPSEANRVLEFCSDQRVGPTLVNVATARDYKRLDLFCETVELLQATPPMTGIVVGRISREEVEQIAIRFDLAVLETDDFTACGHTYFVGPSDFPGDWMDAADVFVSTSDDYEGVSGAAREAASLGLPVVVTPIGATAAWLRSSGRVEWRLASNASERAAAVRDLLAHGRGKRTSMNALEAARQDRATSYATFMLTGRN